MATTHYKNKQSGIDRLHEHEIEEPVNPRNERVERQLPRFVWSNRHTTVEQLFSQLSLEVKSNYIQTDSSASVAVYKCRNTQMQTETILITVIRR